MHRPALLLLSCNRSQGIKEYLCTSKANGIAPGRKTLTVVVARNPVSDGLNVVEATVLPASAAHQHRQTGAERPREFDAINFALSRNCAARCRGVGKRAQRCLSRVRWATRYLLRD